MSCENFTNKFDEYKKIRKQRKLFGTFGFRGVVNEGMGPEKAKRTGAALSDFLGEGKTIAIGKDPRISSLCHAGSGVADAPTSLRVSLHRIPVTVN